MSTAINLRAVVEILETALAEAEDLHGTELDDTDSVLSPRENAAIVSRNLLVLSDTLALASSLTKAEYWHMKGYPRKESLGEAVEA